MSDLTSGNVSAWFVRVLAAREGGAVRRCHIQSTLRTYDVAQHSYGAASLLLLLHPNPSLALVKAVLWHDVAERWLGDLPAPAKWAHTELADAYEDAEEATLQRLKMGPLSDLGPNEVDWLRAVDTMELWLWCREEEALGNTLVKPMCRACETVLNTSDLPERALLFYQHALLYPHRRLPDLFEEVARELGQAGS